MAESRSYSSPAERIRATGEFQLDDIELLLDTLNRYDMLQNTPWDNFRATHCVLPSWFRFGLDPLSEEYARQQEQLWATLAGVSRGYDPATDEKEAPLEGADPIWRPAFFMRCDPESVTSASDHVIATGMILKHCGLKPGDTALEYGAGWGVTALTLARLGVAVDTVDISRIFCGFVAQQAEFFRVPLRSFEGRFGWNPRPDHQYDLIYFFQAFHHCVDFLSVVHDLKRHLRPTGCVLLSGEPIARVEDPFIPYPWGLRLDAETVAHVRRHHWFELGFTQEFLVQLFVNSGFSARCFEGPPLSVSDVYQFKPRSSTINLAKEWLPDTLELGWNSCELEGRWTRGEARLFTDATDSFSKLIIVATSHHPVTLSLEIEYAGASYREEFRAGERKEICIEAKSKGRQIFFRSPAFIPARDYQRTASDSRTLGIFVHSVSYR